MTVHYETLNPAVHEIRLLTLQPGAWNDKVCCELTTRSLDSQPNYEALSYVWGDATLRGEVKVCGAWVSVTVNLESALRRFRLSQAPRSLWVDGLSINQRNLDERSSQVALMGRIYTQCQKVLIWLGDEGDMPLDAHMLPDMHIAHPAEVISTFTKHIESENIQQVLPLIPDHALQPVANVRIYRNFLSYVT
jgi:hypothetical protein